MLKLYQGIKIEMFQCFIGEGASDVFNRIFEELKPCSFRWDFTISEFDFDGEILRCDLEIPNFIFFSNPEYCISFLDLKKIFKDLREKCKEFNIQVFFCITPPDLLKCFPSDMLNRLTPDILNCFDCKEIIYVDDGEMFVFDGIKRKAFGKFFELYTNSDALRHALEYGILDSVHYIF